MLVKVQHGGNSKREMVFFKQKKREGKLRKTTHTRMKEVCCTSGKALEKISLRCTSCIL